MISGEMMSRLDKVAVILFGLVTLLMFAGMGLETYLSYSCKEAAIKSNLTAIEIKEICK